MANKNQRVTAPLSKTSFARVCLNVLSANRTDRLVVGFEQKYGVAALLWHD